MTTEYAEYYQQASDCFAEMGDTLSGCRFDEAKQAVEIFVAQALAICRDHSKAIALLLKADFFAEPIILTRSLFELCFSIHWVEQASDPHERLERVYQLEAQPFSEFNKEVRLIERDVRSSSPHWSPTKYEEFQALLDFTRKNSPFLIDANTGEFKRVPDLASRMGDDNRLRFYHLYRFTSIFTHPTPLLKEVYLRLSGTQQTTPEIIGESLSQTLAYGLLFMELICGYAAGILEKCNPPLAPQRTECYRKLLELVEKGNKGYFGTSNYKRMPGGSE